MGRYKRVAEKTGNVIFFNEGDDYVVVKLIPFMDGKCQIVRNLKTGKLFFRKRVMDWRHPVHGHREDYWQNRLKDKPQLFSHVHHYKDHGDSKRRDRHNHTLIFDLCNGGNLNMLIMEYHASEQIFPEIFIWKALGRLLEALAYMHSGWEGIGKPTPADWVSIAHNDLESRNIFLNYSSRSEAAMPDVVLGDLGQSQELYDAFTRNLWDTESDYEGGIGGVRKKSVVPDRQRQHARLGRDIRYLGKIFIEMVCWPNNKEVDDSYKRMPDWAPYLPASYSQELARCTRVFGDLRDDVNKGQEPTAVQLATEWLPIAKRSVEELMPGYRGAKEYWVRSVHKSGFVVNIPLFIEDEMDDEMRSQVSEIVEPWEWRTVDTLTLR